MKVALVSEWIDEHEGGVARHVRELAGFLKNKIDVSIITNKPEKLIGNTKILEISGARDPVFKINISPNVVKEIREYVADFDVVHAHHAFSRLSLLSISLADKYNIPSVLTTHTSSFFQDYEYFWQFISYIYPRYRLTISKVNKIIAVSEVAKKFISYFTEKNAIVIPNGVSTKKFKPREIERDGEPVILYVGRLVPKKGIDVAIISMKKVIEKYPNAKLVIAGRGKMMPILKSMVAILGIEKNVEFLGYVNDNFLPYLYNSADVFVLPSIMAESFGIVLLEAMSSGLPIVATKVGGIVEVLENGKYGILVEPGNAKEMADGIIKILEDEQLSNNLSIKGRKIVMQKYSWEKISNKIIKVYNELA